MLSTNGYQLSQFMDQAGGDVAIIKMLSDFAQQLFGYSPTNIPRGLISITIQTITERFSGITVEDIQAAFKTQEIEKKDYTALSRDELISPIKRYWLKKNTLIAEINSECRTQQEQQEADRKRYEFRKEAEDHYKNSLGSGSWEGTAFHASVLASDYKKILPEDLVKELWMTAQKEHYVLHKKQKAAQESEDGDKFIAATPIPKVDFYFANLMIEAAIARNIGLIIE